MGNGKKQNTGVRVGIGLAALSGLISALNTTAVPVVFDLSPALLVATTIAVVVLSAGLVREAILPAKFRRRPLWLGIVALAFTTVLGIIALRDGVMSYSSQQVSFSNDEIELAGTLFEPRSRRPLPAVVFVHGSGPETRKEYEFFARLFARNGFAALAYDKRGTGQSTGRLYESDYRDYADDAIAAVRFLAASVDVDRRCIGLVGFSEGEWVAPLAASSTGDIAFLIVVSPSGVSPARQVNAEIALRLSEHGFSDQDIAKALELNGRVFEYQRTGLSSEGLAEDLRVASVEPWFRAAQDIPAELYPPEDYQWWRSVMDFAPGPVWEKVSVPALLLKGGQDQNSPAELARREILTALGRGGNTDVTFTVFPKADHSMLRWPLGRTVPLPVFATGYLQTMVKWAETRRCVRR